MTGNDFVYRRFIEWLATAWAGLPKSPYRLEAIRAFYAPAEAELLTGIPFSARSIDDLAAMKEMKPEDLAPMLDALARRGGVWRGVKGETVYYRLNDAFFTFTRSAFWPERPDERARASVRPFNKYFYDGFMDPFSHSNTKGLRTIPIRRTIKDPRRIPSYEDVLQFVDAQDYFVVACCPCRQRKNLDPDAPDCPHPVEVCLHFGRLAHYMVDNGLGREITRGETKEILTLSAESGLVHAISNWQKTPDTICNCCRCCCVFFEAFHVLGHDKSHDPSNYRVHVRAETCRACGLCVDRCPVDALSLKASPAASGGERKAVFLSEPDRCLGCGVCVYKCPTGSLSLERREETCDPPADPGEWMKRWVEDTKTAGGREA